ncbi:MAG TPA: glycosyltransferase family protein [Steroidobacteraceae bacterium]|jgi:spore coat polysaccharide biosynthesis protein SpsF|nr:glycosyltransferase family protein [Steroidobacteraceae bacterium]
MIAIIVQARMGSTRLPGKVLKPIAGRPMFAYQLERLRRVRGVQRIVVATTTAPADDRIVEFCAGEGVACTRGSEQDVLLRYFEAATACAASSVVRVTSDCPLLDPDVVEQALDTFRERQPCDYVSNMLEPTWPYGMAVEVCSMDALTQAHREAREPAEREHVTPFIYWRPTRFRLQSLTRTPDLSHHRWTVDTPEDFELVSRIITTLYPREPQFRLDDVLALLAANPSWEHLNAHVQQKSVRPDTRAQS